MEGASEGVKKKILIVCTWDARRSGEKEDSEGRVLLSHSLALV